MSNHERLNLRHLACVATVATMSFAVGCGPRTSGKSSSTENKSGVNGATNNATTATNNGSTTSNSSTTSCGGCVDGTTCLAGDSPQACGADGEQCSACADGWACFEGDCVQPPSCGPSNCDGCCDPVRGCVVGSDPAACGAQGEVCDVCAGNQRCAANVCTAPCAETCAGCCVGEVCEGGDTDAACGSGGGACSACDAQESCTAGSCVGASCLETCNGCCDGNTCNPGTADSACGGVGDACVNCGTGRTCSAGACVTDPASRWEVILVSGEISAVNQMGDRWDIIGTADPVVDFELVDPGNGVAYRATSSVAQDDTTPNWNESVLTDVPAAAFQHWKIDVWDSDLDLDDPVCGIDIDVDAATYQDLFTGATYTFSCQDPGSTVFANINVRLQ